MGTNTGRGVSNTRMRFFRRRRPDYGRFTAWWLLAAAALLAVAQARAEDVTLNLKDADIGAVIRTVSEITGKNFIVDPRVKGKITIISSRPMNQNEIYQVFLSILDVHGFAAVPSGRVIKIVPDANAKQDAVPMATDRRPGEGDEIVTRVIELNNVSASQLVPILRPLIPQQGHLAAYVPSNILIISDHAANIARMMDIIRRIDLPSSEEIEVVPLRHASAAEVVRILNTLDQQGKTRGAAPWRGRVCLQSCFLSVSFISSCFILTSAIYSIRHNRKPVFSPGGKASVKPAVPLSVWGWCCAHYSGL